MKKSIVRLLFVSFICQMGGMVARAEQANTEMKKEGPALGLGLLFPNGFISTEWLGEYEQKSGKRYADNTSYEQRTYIGSRFLNGAVNTKFRLGFLKRPHEREVTFDDVHLINTLTLFDTGYAFFKGRMTNIFPTSMTRYRTKTIIAGNLAMFTEFSKSVGSFVPGFSVWTSNEIYQRKKYQNVKTGRATVNRAELVNEKENHDFQEIEQPVDLDIEAGFLVDYTLPGNDQLFVELSFFDQRRWYSHGKYSRWYYAELFCRYDLNPRIFIYQYTRLMFDSNLNLTEVRFSNPVDDRGAVLTRVALGMQF